MVNGYGLDPLVFHGAAQQMLMNPLSIAGKSFSKCLQQSQVIANMLFKLVIILKHDTKYALSIVPFMI